MMGKFAPNAVSSALEAERVFASSDGVVDDTAARVAVALATTPEGRAAGLSVEVWPDRDVMLRVRSEHELRVFVEQKERALWVRWERTDPVPGGRPQVRRGRLGKLHEVDAQGLRVFMARWLAWRVRG